MGQRRQRLLKVRERLPVGRACERLGGPRRGAGYGLSPSSLDGRWITLWVGGTRHSEIDQEEHIVHFKGTRGAKAFWRVNTAAVKEGNVAWIPPRERGRAVVKSGPTGSQGVASDSCKPSNSLLARGVESRWGGKGPVG